MNDEYSSVDEYPQNMPKEKYEGNGRIEILPYSGMHQNLQLSETQTLNMPRIHNGLIEHDEIGYYMDHHP